MTESLLSTADTVLPEDVYRLRNRTASSVLRVGDAHWLTRYLADDERDIVDVSTGRDTLLSRQAESAAAWPPPPSQSTKEW